MERYQKFFEDEGELPLHFNGEEEEDIDTSDDYERLYDLLEEMRGEGITIYSLLKHIEDPNVIADELEQAWLKMREEKEE